MNDYKKYTSVNILSSDHVGIGRLILLTFIGFLLVISFSNTTDGFPLIFLFGIGAMMFVSLNSIKGKGSVDLIDLYPINYKKRVLYNLMQALKAILYIGLVLFLFIVFFSLFEVIEGNNFIDSLVSYNPFNINFHFLTTLLSFNMFTFLVGFLGRSRRTNYITLIGILIYLLVNGIIVSLSNNKFLPVGIIDYNNITSTLNIIILIVSLIQLVSIFVFIGISVYVNKPKKGVN